MKKISRALMKNIGPALAGSAGPVPPPLEEASLLLLSLPEV